MSDTFPDETLYPVLEALADEDRIFASNSAVSHESSQIKGSTIKGLINALKGTPPETLDTLAKLAAAINNDPSFHATLTTALGLKQDKSNAMTTNTTQDVTGTKTYRTSALYYGPATPVNHTPFAFGCGGSAYWGTRQYTNGTLVWQSVPTGGGSAQNVLGFVYGSDGSLPNLVLYNTPTAPTAAPGTNTTQLANCAFVQAALAGASGVPAGVICMWSGTIATVPTGWALCDGANGTPDLVDRFVVAAGSTAGGDKYDPGDTGGLDSVTLDLTQIPAHTHAGTTAGGGAHTHDVPYWNGSSGPNPMIDKRDSAAGSGGENPNWYATDWHYGHNHTFTTDSKGGGGGHENRPPYYALAFIMKL